MGARARRLRSGLAALRGARRDRGASALVVPVQAAGRAVSAWPGDAGTLCAPGMPFHVTVLFPFLAAAQIDAEAERSLREIAAAYPPFAFELAELARFEGVLYLGPRPAEPFRALTEAVHARWPQHPPYAGRFDSVIPHVTIATGPEPVGLASAVESQLPIAAAAEELWLLTPRPGGAWSKRARFALAGGAPAG
jgi:2'-5' RNA ligase